MTSHSPSYASRRIAEIRAELEPRRSAVQVLNSRFHYARCRYSAPFDLWWSSETETFVLRVTAGRRKLPVPAGAQLIGRYDSTATWETVKADFIALIGGAP